MAYGHGAPEGGTRALRGFAVPLARDRCRWRKTDRSSPCAAHVARRPVRARVATLVRVSASRRRHTDGTRPIAYGAP
eukprot:5873215-Prymnesium_polylepis.1